jgi:hypothetical protein
MRQAGPCTKQTVEQPALYQHMHHGRAILWRHELN